jgi:4-amino-4-deoxy-L-arabinose transferase-like glycosyltransferase
MNKESVTQKFLNLFRYGGKIDPIVIILCLVINLIVLVNAILHYPKIGYDAVENLNYVQILPDRLPSRQDTYEFFSPPLPYFLPSRFDIICEKYVSDTFNNKNDINSSPTCRIYDGKFAQGLNLLLSIGTTILLLMIAGQIQPGNRFFKISALMMLALLTVYYKTFSQVRDEPYVVFFIALSIFLINQLLRTTTFTFKLVLAIGITLGLLVLSRQWGFFIFPAIFLLVIWVFIQDRRIGWLRARQFFLITLLSALVGGWFYVHLYLLEGTFAAFDKKVYYPPPFSEALAFFGQTDIRSSVLYRAPLRPVFDHQSFFAIMYSETWGDYWGYFTFVKPGVASDGQGNQASIGPYLGQVNLVSIFPSLLLLGSFVFGLIQIFRFRKSPTLETSALVFIAFLGLSTILGYLWFVYKYFDQTDLVVKATYIIQFFIALLFLFAGFMEVIRKRSQLAYNLILFLMILVFIHNAPALITRYSKLFGY